MFRRQRRRGKFQHSNLGIGALGEEISLRFLQEKGFLLADRNWRCRAGEIDLVCWDGPALVFVEVKTRLESPQVRRYLFENVDMRKQRKLRRLVELYLLFHYGERGHPAVRIDLLGVVLSRDCQRVVAVEHLTGAI